MALQEGKQPGEKHGGIVGACNGEPEYKGEHKEHKRVSCLFACQKAIQLPVFLLFFIGGFLDNPLTDFFRAVKECGSHKIGKVFGLDAGGI